MRHRVGRTAALLSVLAAALFTVGAVPSSPTAAQPTVPSPTLTAPPAGLRGFPLWDSYYQLAPFGYEEQEYFVSGTAVDAGGAAAPYTTRIIVTRPTDPAAFNGTVLLDWVNVTAQFENSVDTMHAREMLMREGFTFVHMSAQSAGVCCIPLTPKIWDPVRYAALNHPGDAWAADIVTQIARAFEAPAPAPSLDPMGALGGGSVERILATGQSQSANRLAGYIQNYLPAHPEAVGVIDGILVHGNVPGTKSFAVGALVPVIQMLSDFEAVDDGVDPAAVDPNYRLWEVGGAAHSDLFIGYQSVAGLGPRVLAGAPQIDEAAYRQIIQTAGNYGEVIDPLLAVCVVAGASMPTRYVTSAALVQLDQWAAGGAPPPNGPRFEFAAGALAKDEHGNTRGGIRMPPMEVPVARYESTACPLGGLTIPFLDPQIQALYGTHAEYYTRMAASTDEAVEAGFLLPEDAIDLMRRACAASVRFGHPGAACAAYDPPTFEVAPSSATPVPVGAPSPPAAVPSPTSSGVLAVGGGSTAGLLALCLLGLALAVRRRLPRFSHLIVDPGRDDQARKSRR